MRSSPSTKDLTEIADAWNLQEACDFAQSCFAGVSSMPTRDEHVRTFTVTYHPKVAMAWSQITTPETSHIQGIIFVGREQRAEMLRILKSQWSTALASHAMFPAFLCGLMLGHELDFTLDGIKSDVREIEVRTGHHRFDRRQEQPASGELGQLSAKMSGCAAKLANCSRKLKVTETLNDFMLLQAESAIARRNLQTEDTAAPAYTSPYDKWWSARPTTALVEEGIRGSELLKHHIKVMKDRAEMQVVDNEYMRQRVQVQIAALFHLIAQQDNAIAFDTARASRSIAESSQQDSSSMKMLAIVAMFFLPGSFVAALFSTPLFEWDLALGSSSIGLGTKPQFALFWAVTIPLTLLTFLFYGVGLLSQSRKRAKAEGKDHVDLQTITTM